MSTVKKTIFSKPVVNYVPTQSHSRLSDDSIEAYEQMANSMGANFQDHDDPYEILEETHSSKELFPNIRDRLDDEDFTSSDVLNEANYMTSAYMSTHGANHNAPHPSEYIRQNSGSSPNTTVTPIFSRYTAQIGNRGIISNSLMVPEAAEVLDSERGRQRLTVNETPFQNENRPGHRRNQLSLISEQIQEEMKHNENQQSPRSANIEESHEETKRQTEVKNLKAITDSFQSNKQGNQKFSIKARQIMEIQNHQRAKSREKIDIKNKKDLVEIRLFKKSLYYKALEQAALLGEDLAFRVGSDKYELDSDDGQAICKNYLGCIERFFSIISIKTQPRQYRERFSKAYKVLYSPDELGYLPEILDSAQESFPYLWVNGEKYVFSKDVLDAGLALFQYFTSLKNYISDFAKKMAEESITDLKILNKKKTKLEQMLDQFDLKWTHYEKCYVFELMVIETDARRYIVDAIQYEQQLTDFEQQQKKRGVSILTNNKDYNELRSKFLTKVCEINAVANVQGKGRDDFKIEILLKAEELTKKTSPVQSIAVKSVSEKIKQSFLTFRVLVRKYNENVEVVDPQLKNNQELVEVLSDFEKSWTLGKEHLLDSAKCHHLVTFSTVIEASAQKHKAFGEQIEYREADIFISIPSLLILNSLEDDNGSREICQRFFPPMLTQGEDANKKYSELLEEFSKQRLVHCGASGIPSKQSRARNQRLMNSFDFYNELEKTILGVSIASSSDFSKINSLIQQLGMALSRHNPSEWNEFMTACLGSN